MVTAAGRRQRRQRAIALRPQPPATYPRRRTRREPHPFLLYRPGRGTHAGSARCLPAHRPLPEGAPPSFSGAVGQFELAAETDTTETVVNDTVTIKLILSGSGNLETMGDPQWPDMPGWRAFDSQATTESYIEDGNVDEFVRSLELVVKANGSVSEFARATNLNRSNLHSIFRHKNKPQFETILRIFSQLGYHLKVA